MVRKTRDSISKSLGRADIKSRWPAAWTTTDRDNIVDVCFHDGLQLLNDIANSPEWNLKPCSMPGATTEALWNIGAPPTANAPQPTAVKYVMRDLVRALKLAVESYIKKFNKTKHYILCFDKYYLVPLAKSHAQAAHDKGKNIVPRDELPPLEFGLDAELPIDLWPSYMADRHGYRREIIAFVVMELMNLSGDSCVDIPVGKTLIVDGHCLSEKQVRYLLTNKSQLDGIALNEHEDGFCELDCYPIAYTKLEIQPQDYSDLLEDTDCTYVELLVDYKNTLGEADFGPFFFLETNHRHNEDYTPTAMIHKPYRSIEIISVDTDLAYLSAIYLEKCKLSGRTWEQVPQIYIRQSRLAAYKNKQYLNVNMLVQLITNDQSMNGCGEAPIACMFAALSAAGSDYTEYHYFVPYVHFMNALTAQLHRHKPLVRINKGQLWKGRENSGVFITEEEHNEVSNQYKHIVKLDAEAYVQLLLYAYGYARKQRINPEEFTSLAVDNINYYLNGANGKPPLEADKHFPCPEDIVVSAKQLLYYLEMCLSVGEANVDKLYPLSYGYRMLDPNNGFTRGNLYRVILNPIE
jgi:hypothetical protein